jgi:hypothetical protein
MKAIKKHWRGILALYEAFEDKRPVMHFDLQAGKVYAYPYQEYKAGLSNRSQALLERQYTSAIKDGMMILFVQDKAKRKLLSYSFACSE